jgi:hypothetical protein
LEREWAEQLFTLYERLTAPIRRAMQPNSKSPRQRREK